MTRLVAFLIAAASFAAAQIPADQQIVTMNVVATDNHGKPVNDVSASDLAVTDAGKSQMILFFRRFDRRLPPPVQLAPGEYSNRNAATIPHATVVLFDFMNERFSTRAQAENVLVKYLESVESADYLYVYFLTIDGQVVPVRGLNSEAPPGGEEWTKNIKAVMDAATRAVLKVRPPDLDVWTRTVLTFRALDALGAELERVPGRKNVVWITDGVPIDLGPIRSGTGQVIDFAPQLRQLSTALAQTGVAVYPVSEIMIGSSAVLSDVPGDGGGGGGSMPGLGSRDTLDQIAGMTGGRPVGIRDIGSAITQAMNDARTSYELGYTPPPENWDSRFHKIHVACRRKGVRIQVQTGYYAWPEPPGARAVAAIRSMARNPMDAAEIGMRGSIGPAAGVSKAMRLHVNVNAADVITIANADRYVGRLSAAILSYGPDGPMAGLAAIPPITPMEITWTAAQRDGALKSGIVFEKDLTVDADVKEIRVVVYDDYGGTLGSLTMPVRSPVNASGSK